MSCVLPFVFVAGLVFNPCTIQEINPRFENKPDGVVEECVVKHRHEEEDRVQVSRLKMSCDEVEKTISEQIQKNLKN